MQILDAAGQLPDQAMGPHAGIMNEGLESFAGGGARGDDVMGAMPMLPPLGKLFGMAGRLRGAGGAYQGTQPIAGSQGIPHTSPLPNQGPPVMGGAPPSGGGYADDAAGLMRGDIPLEKPRLGADFQAMDDLGPMADAPIDRSARMGTQGAGYDDAAAYAQRAEPLTTRGRNFGMDIPQTQMPPSAGLTPYGLDNVFSEFNALNSQGQMPYEDIVEYLVGKHGDWILDFI